MTYHLENLKLNSNLFFITYKISVYIKGEWDKSLRGTHLFKTWIKFNLKAGKSKFHLAPYVSNYPSNLTPEMGCPFSQF